jgi:hypothetical protein
MSEDDYDYLGVILRAVAEPVVTVQCPHCHHTFQYRPPVELVTPPLPHTEDER